MPKITKKRDSTIDFARGFATLLIPLIHVAPYYFKVRYSYEFFNWGQFVVPIIVYASFKLGFGSGKGSYLAYIFARLRRLYVPYVIFFVIYSLIEVYFKQKLQPAPYYIASLLLYGGVSFSWLVLLYVYFAIMAPILGFLSATAKRWFVVLCIVFCALGVAYLFVPHLVRSNYRLYMLPTWLLLAIFCAHYARFTNKVKLVVFVAFVSLFAALHMSAGYLKFNTGFYVQKYPPTIYFLLYSFLSVQVFDLLARYVTFGLLGRLWHYLSRNSYTIFFAHLVIIEILDLSFPRRNLEPIVFVGIVYVATFAYVAAFDAFKNYFTRRKSE